MAYEHLLLLGMTQSLSANRSYCQVPNKDAVEFDLGELCRVDDC
jgi:hypothetical protein